jgi:hypothetical protein
MRLTRFLILFLLFLAAQQMHAQAPSSWREKTVQAKGDTVVLDSLSLVPGTFTISAGSVALDSTQYRLVPTRALLVLYPTAPHENLRVRYAVYPLLFTQSRSHKDQLRFTTTPVNRLNPFLYRPQDNKAEDPFATGGLNKSGSLSRGISFGNNRDVSVSSSLNLQLSGKLTENVDVVMAATDDNLPIQPDGTTQQLQEFDRVYIQLSGKGTRLIAGDFFTSRPKSYFMNFNKRGQGLHVTTLQPVSIVGKDTSMIRVTGAVAISKGKFSRNVIQGVEGNQGPYRLRGSENELFIVVLSGTEKVYIDGRLLVRGQENDYVIDYNTAEVTFTAKQLITKDKRIVIEFQYTDRNYSRSLVHAGVEYRQKDFELRFNAFSEQDNKNQPLQQALTTEDKLTMAAVGDTLLKAVVPGVDSVTFSGDLVLYRRIDSLVGSTLYPDVYVYSTNPDSAHFRLSFSYVGPNNGNYIQVSSSANGKTFKWVAPVSGIPQGDHEPVVLLITPKKRQMVTLGSTVGLRFGVLDAEVAYTNNDVNTFSRFNSLDDHGYGANVNFTTGFQVTDSLLLGVTTRYELVSRYFTPLERFRPVEFERDWNLGWGQSRVQTAEQNFAGVGFTLKQKSKPYSLSYNYSMFREGTFYNGVKNDAAGAWSIFGTNLAGNLSVLQSTSEGANTSFIRQSAMVSRQIFKHVVLKLSENQEINRQVRPGSPALLNGSAGFFEWEAAATIADSTKRSFTIFYKQRNDLLPSASELERATFAEQFGGTLQLNGKPNQSLRLTAAWRKLQITSPALTQQQPDNTLVGRIEYSLRAWKGAVTMTTFYEAGSGLEVKKEYSYIEVPAGQGNFTWSDYNGDGVKQLNEFEVALYSDQAQYIRVFTPTNQYVKVYTNQFSQSLNLRPGVKWANSKGVRGLIGRFSDQVVYRVDRKTMSRAPEHSLAPLLDDSGDTALVTLNATIRNTISFNQLSNKFGMDLTVQDVRGKNLLTNGIESRSNAYREIHARWNITKMLSLITEYRDGTKSNSSEFFSTRNYRIRYYETEPKFSIQPGTTFRVSFNYRYSVKRNAADLGNESATLQKFGTEIKLSKLSKGSFDAEANYIRIAYTGTVASAVGYDMLEGLKPGQNLTWRLTWQQSLAQNLQLTIGYEGRKTPGTLMVHTGTAQVRAIF